MSRQPIRRRTEPAFIEPMQCKSVTALPAGEKWTFEIKFDGYRCIAVKRGKEATLFSRNQKVLNKRFPKVVDVLASLAGDFVLDGELVALDPQGRPSFQLLQNNLSHAHEFVVGGYIPGAHGFDVLLVGVYEKRELIFVAKVKDGFVPRIGRNLASSQKTGSGALPIRKSAREKGLAMGRIVNRKKLAQCRWVTPKSVCQVAFVEWTDAGHLRHCTFRKVFDSSSSSFVTA